MYLNLDLLYNVEIYFFPLFYYKHGYSSFVIYSPITKKSVECGNCCNDHFIYCDYISCKSFLKTTGFNNGKMESFKKEDYSITEIEYIFFNIKYSKCNLIKLKKEELEYLKSNIRVNFFRG